MLSEDDVADGLEAGGPEMTGSKNETIYSKQGGCSKPAYESGFFCLLASKMLGIKIVMVSLTKQEMGEFLCRWTE